MCFPANFAKFLRTPSFTEHFWWLLLQIVTAKASLALNCRVTTDSIQKLSNMIFA